MVIELTYKNGRSELLVVDYIKDKVIDENKSFAIDEGKSLNFKNIQPPKFVKYLEYKVSEDFTVSRIWFVKNLSRKNYKSFETKIVTSDKEVKGYITNPDYSVIESYELENIPKGGLQPCMSPVSAIPVSIVQALRVLSL